MIETLTRMVQAIRYPGYAPGRLTSRLKEDLSGFEVSDVEMRRARFKAAGTDIEFDVYESVEINFLMTIVVAEFLLELGPCDREGEEIRITHRGVWRRSGIDFEARGAPGADVLRLRTTLESHARLSAALLPLDFTKCRLVTECGQWRLRLQHFACCEIVGALPGFRRYIRLVKEQRAALLATFTAVKDAYAMSALPRRLH